MSLPALDLAQPLKLIVTTLFSATAYLSFMALHAAPGINCDVKIIVAKNLKRLNISRNPVGQEEKQGKARFPLAILSTAEQSTNTLPCGTAKARTRGGAGRCRSEAQRKNLFHKQKNTRQNDTTGCIKTRPKIVMHITQLKKCVQFGSQIIKHYLCHRNNKSKELC